MQFQDDGKKRHERRRLLEKLTEPSEKPSLGAVFFVVSPRDRRHGVAWDDGGYGFLALVLCLGHSNKLFSLDQLAEMLDNRFSIAPGHETISL